MNRLTQMYEGGNYPVQPKYNPNCSSNVIYQTLPQDWPVDIHSRGSNSMKHIYGKGLNSKGRVRYPCMKKAVPRDTMYGTDFTRRDQSGDIKHHHFQAYPLTNRYVREVDEFVNYKIKVPRF